MPKVVLVSRYPNATTVARTIVTALWACRQPAVGFAVRSPDQLAGELVRTSEREPAPVVLVDAVTTEEGHGWLATVADMLQQSCAPVVVLTDTAAAVKPWFEGLGVAILPADVSPTELAGVIFGVSSRQAAVETLRRDLRVTQVSAGGVRAELDRLHEELNLAAKIQREFLPKSLPSVPGLELGVLFRPCGYVSGDIYDAQLLDEHHLGLFLADAVGHGAPAALLTMALCRSLVTRELSGDSAKLLEPAEVLARLNRAMCSFGGGPNRFATAVYGVLDLRTMELTLAGAGHPHPLVLEGPGASPLSTDGPMLGVFDDGVYDQTQVHLKTGQTLMLYSDGMEVAFPNVDAEGHASRRPTKNYLEHFLRLGTRDSAGLNEALWSLEQALDAQAGSLQQADDVTALAISPLGAGLRLAA